jgi:hypothetical protein
MTKKKLGYLEMCEVTKALMEKGFDGYGLVIEQEVDTHEELNKINDDVYYRTSPDKDSKPEYGDAIMVGFSGTDIKFKITLKANENDKKD